MWFAALNQTQSLWFCSPLLLPPVGINSRTVLSPEPSRHQVFPAATKQFMGNCSKNCIGLDVSSRVTLQTASSCVYRRKKNKNKFSNPHWSFLHSCRTKGINHIYRDKPFRMELVFYTDVETHPFHLISYLPFLIIKTRLHKPTIS